MSAIPLPLFDTPTTSLVQSLERTLQILQQGWCQCNQAYVAENRSTDAMDPEATACCLWGAIYRATHCPAARGTGFAACLQFVALRLTAQGQHIDSLVRFNDALGQTQELVVLFLRHCLTAARSQESSHAPTTPSI